MKQSSILSFTSFLSLVAAVPHNHKAAHVAAPHHKRAQVIHWDVETVVTTVTAWLPSGDPRLGHEDAQYTQGSGGDHSAYQWSWSPAESSAVPSTTLTTSTASSSSSVAAATTSVAAPYIPASSAPAPTSSALATSDSEQQTTSVPVVSTTSSTISSTSETPTQVATTQATTQAESLAPAPASSIDSSSSAPPASSTTASYSSGSGSETASYLNGHCSGPDNPCSGDITTYTAGLGTCGFSDSDGDFIVALSRQSWENVKAQTEYSTGNMICSFCSKKISVTLNGNTKIGTIRDKCNGNQCANYSLNHAYDIDLSGAMFAAIGGTSARGRYSPPANDGKDEISWYFL